MINSTILANGVHVVTKRLRGHHSTALGLWLLNGSRHETTAQTGYAHFLEHLFFKGTEQLDGPSLGVRLEAMGGQVNAHTGRELTALHGLVPKGYVPELLQILGGMLCRPRFDDHDVSLERQVILQELAMVEDNPEEALEDRAMGLAWPEHPLGQPILGRPEVIERATAATLRDYMRHHLSGDRIWVVAAGDVEHESLVTACRDLGQLPAGKLPRQPPPQFTPGIHAITLPGEQSQLLWIMPIPAANADDHYARLVANHVLGGGVSSRLFQELRERRGLVYGIHSRLEFYSDGGTWSIHTACDPRRANACRDIVSASVEQLLQEGINEQELDIARRHLGAGLLIDEDHPDSIMERLAREAVYLRRHPDFPERMERLKAVTAETARAALATAWAQRLHAYTTGAAHDKATSSRH
ncbi:MAG: pitrilysin family protein [Gammaproteobacteria bacterium]|jgi:predicted Zn-dependent peptidase